MVIGGPTPEVQHAVTNGAAVTVVKNASDAPISNSHTNAAISKPLLNNKDSAAALHYSFNHDSNNLSSRIHNGHPNININPDPSQQLQSMHLIQQQHSNLSSIPNISGPPRNPVMGLASALEGLSVATPPPNAPSAATGATHNPAAAPQLIHPHAHPHAHLAHIPVQPGHHIMHPGPHHPHHHHNTHPMLPPTTMQMWVPQERVGAVIGSQGTVIRNLQERSRATIQVHNETIRGDRKLFTIVGGPQECQLARQLVTEIIERHRNNGIHNNSNNNNHSNGTNNNSTPHSPNSSNNMNPQQQRGDRTFSEGDGNGNGARQNHLTKTVFVPTSCVGLVIGRRGETIRDLQAKSGASIFVTRDRDAAHGSSERSVTISGTEQAINRADMLVRQIVRDAHVRRNAQGTTLRMNNMGPIQMETLTVPDDKVGLIIGKGGTAIRELQSISGAKIQVAKEDEVSSNSNTRPVTITGIRSCIETARALIAEKVNMHLPPNNANNNGNVNHGNNGNIPAYGSPQQGGFPNSHNTAVYYPMYDAATGFPHAMQPPYQHQLAHGHPQSHGHPGHGHMDPNNEQMRAAMAYYHQYHFGYAQHAQVMHQMPMQQAQPGGGENQEVGPGNNGEQGMGMDNGNSNSNSHQDAPLETHITQSASDDTITISVPVGDTVQGMEEGGAEEGVGGGNTVSQQQQIHEPRRMASRTPHGGPHGIAAGGIVDPRMQQQMAHAQQMQAQAVHMAHIRAAQMHHHHAQVQQQQQQGVPGISGEHANGNGNGNGNASDGATRRSAAEATGTPKASSGGQVEEEGAAL